MEVRQTYEFPLWLDRLRDRQATRRIRLRVQRIADTGNLGDIRGVGKGVSEIKLDFGPGYRIYFTRRGDEIIMLLSGGDKSTQAQDILIAQRMAAALD